jgi:proline racemase
LDVDVSYGGAFYISVSVNERLKVPMAQLVDIGEGEWDLDLARKAQFKTRKEEKRIVNLPRIFMFRLYE